jgi:hypothetical protein
VLLHGVHTLVSSSMNRRLSAPVVFAICQGCLAGSIYRSSYSTLGQSQ